MRKIHHISFTELLIVAILAAALGTAGYYGYKWLGNEKAAGRSLGKLGGAINDTKSTPFEKNTLEKYENLAK